jgi:hypothetical protein
LALPQNEYEEGREVLAREICIEVIEQEKVRPIKDQCGSTTMTRKK